jgi:methyltransferase (TIGR00027 family)
VKAVKAMKRADHKAGSAHDRRAVPVYYAINILLFPVTLLGYVIWLGKAALTGRRSGVSITAQAPLMGRWTMHYFGTREDAPSYQLLMLLPSISPLAVRLIAAAGMLAHRLTGYVPRAFRYPFEGDIPRQYEAAARMAFFDAAVDRYLPNMAQFVILGAGFDTRAFRLPKDLRVRSFEVDTPRTQAIKRRMIAKTALDASRITFVPANFEKGDWFARLLSAGFDPSKPALFLWEGVVMYLDREAVEDTLRKIGSCAAGSIVAFDYFTTEMLTSQELYWRFARMSTKAAGEPLKFGVESRPPTRERLTELLQPCGLSLVEQHVLGKEAGKERAWGGFALAIVN